MKTLPSNPRVTYKPATQSDIIEFYGARPSHSIKALAFYVDGELAGLGGWKMENGSYVIFSEIKSGIVVEKATIFRCAKVILDMVSEEGCPMYASTENPKFLEKLGFTPLETVSDSKGFYVWAS